MVPAAMSARMACETRSSRCEDIPIRSGSIVGSPCAAAVICEASVAIAKTQASAGARARRRARTATRDAKDAIIATRTIRCVGRSACAGSAIPAASPPPMPMRYDRAGFSISQSVEAVMDEVLLQPKQIDDVDPHYRWNRALPALGPMGVDFEERVDFRRLHRYRLGRARQALEASELGALLCFDVNNIRYVTSTKIGEWERDKLCRFTLLPRGGEPILWDFGSAAMVDGVYQLINDELKPGVREADIVAMATKFLYEHGSDDVEAINAISGERCNPHPHNFTDRMIRPGDQAFFDVLQSFMGYRTCYYRTFNVGRATPAQHDAYKLCREWLDRSIELIRLGVMTDKVASVWPKAQDFGFPD